MRRLADLCEAEPLVVADLARIGAQADRAVAVGATREQVVPRDGELHVLPLMTMTLTCDHRAVDGATGAAFLKTVKAFLEDPGLAL